MKHPYYAAGAYYPDEGPGQTNNDRSSTFQLRNGVGVFGGFAGTETLRTQRNWVSNVTILSGNIDQSGDNSGNAYSVTTGSATDATAVLDGFTVKDGNSDDSGGGMLIGFGSPTVRNCTFTANSAVNGGGMSNEHAPFDKNQAERDLRMNKVRQKVSGGFRSLQVGKEFMDVRFFIATANKQGADPIEELVHFSRQATMLTCGSLGTLNSYNSSSQSSTL